MVVMIEDYLGQFAKSEPMRLRGARLRCVKILRALLMEFFEGVNNLRIPSVNYEDCVKAQKGKLELQQRIKQAIRFAYTTTL